jgi:hypothetical protein
MVRRRLIWSEADAAFAARGLDEAVAAFQVNLGTSPAVVLVDGFAWDEPGAAAVVADAKASAARTGAELWMTARDAPPGAPGRRRALAPLSDGCAELVDVGVFLEPSGRHARLTLVKDFGRFPASALPLVLDAGVLRLTARGDAAEERFPDAFTLLASGSAGAEEAFGACAERWGVGEVNYTYAGRPGIARRRGLVELSPEELSQGDVSAAYVKAHLHRALTETPALRQVLQAIWHQVSGAGEVFAVGGVNADRTARGGTGWAVELARHWGKPVHLFDQDRRRWLCWGGQDWVPAAPPVITCERFAGAGTRSLSEDGRAAIRELFERSFGAAPA